MLKTLVKAFTCTTCCDTIYSRCKEDDRGHCQCGRSEIRNGLDNPIVTINSVELVLPNLTEIEVRADKDTLYWDWNLMTDEFGVIPELPVPTENYQPEYTHAFPY